MEIIASSFDLAEGKPWASGVARSAVRETNAALFEVQCSRPINVGINFDSSPNAKPKIVVEDSSTGEFVRAYITLPVADWNDRQSARPIAVASLVSCLMSAATEIGANDQDILQSSLAAEIEIGGAAPRVDTFIDESVDLNETHPHLDPVLTSATNEYGPVGNDTGADVLGFYRQWRNDGHHPAAFFPALLKKWDIQIMDASEISHHLLAENSFDILTYDDASIGFAFAQYFVDGTVDSDAKTGCLNAIDRQKNPLVIKHRGWSSQKERIEALNKMQTFIQKLDG